MKFTLSWLQEFLDTDADLATIDRTLTAIGLEVEEIVDAGAALADFTVAEILAAEKHPDADKLQICRVQSDAGELQIVCGAPNARAGIKVALAKVGALIPNGGFKIKQSKIRGVESCGMLCSADELGIGGDAAGIIELPEHAAIGESVASVLGLNDPVIEIAITPNRGDCLGVYGIARDLAAAGVGTLKPLNIPAINGQGACPVEVRIEDDQCRQFVACAIRGVKNEPSPDWLQQRLKAIGLRPISTLVDITNYITFTYGRPLHVYDMAKLKGGITVRKAQEGEAFAALNDQSYTLVGGECAITDDSGLIGLGGIVGGESTGVDESTTDVLLECAWFDPIAIAQAGRKHQVLSDARYRFERTVDPEFLLPGAKLAVQMILDLCGGQASELSVTGEAVNVQRSIAFEPDFTNRLGGMIVNHDQQQAILESLGFEVIGDQVKTPSWRPDVEGKADVAEEVLRIVGYDNVPAVAMPKPDQVAAASVSAVQKRTMNVRRALATRGLHETHTWAFVSEETAALFGEVNDALRLQNPISADLSVMRPSLTANLVDALMRNQARGFRTASLFEVGPQFSDPSPSGQQIVACGVRAGEATGKGWNEAARSFDWLDAKADALAVLEQAGMAANKVQIARGAPDYYHPGRSGVVQLGPKKQLAYFGELHPALLQAFDCDVPVMACEVMLDIVPQPKASKTPVALSVSDYQSVSRDFAFVMDADQPAGDLLRVVEQSDKKLIQSVRLFDVYQGKGLEDNQKSIALSVQLQAADRTLSEQDIDAVSKVVIASAQKVGALLRG